MKPKPFYKSLVWINPNAVHGRIKPAIWLVFLAVNMATMHSHGQQVSIRGRVVDGAGKPLVGVNVYTQGAKKGTTTDADGTFTISGLQQRTYSLTASFIGCESQTIRAEPGMHIDFVLKPRSVALKALVVTAQKQAQPISEIPTAVTAISSGFLQRSGVTELDQLSSYVPGLQVQLQSPNNPGFVIRGITSDDGASNIEPRVSVFQDGVSISKSRGSAVELYDLERVEVLKGPQGTLFGRSAEIGAIHIIQNKAQNNTSGSISAGYGDYDYKQVQGFFNTPLVKDKLFARLAGIYKYHDGFIRNLSGGRLNGKDTYAFRNAWRYKPGESTHINLIYNYQRDTPPGTSFKSGTYAPSGGDAKPWTAADLDRGKALGLERTVWGVTTLAKHSFSPDFSLTSTTAYREFRSDEACDADGTAAPALYFEEDAFGKQFSQELRANFKMGKRFEGFGGMSYFYEDGFQHVPFQTDEQSLAVLISRLPPMKRKVESILNPINALLARRGIEGAMSWSPKPLLTSRGPTHASSISDFITNNSNLSYINPAGAAGKALYSLLEQTGPEGLKQSQQLQAAYALFTRPLGASHSESYTNYGDNSSYDFFIDGTYRLTDRLWLTGGLRLTVENIESGYEATTDPNGKDGSLGFLRMAGKNDLFLPTERLDARDTYTAMVGRIAASFSLAKNQEIYADLSKGRRPNVIQFKPTGGQSDRHYEVDKLQDETVWSYEIGLKGLTKNHRFYHDLSAFYYDYSHFQSQYLTKDAQLLTLDAGNATAYGLEADFRYSLSHAWRVFANYAFINATFDDTDSEGHAQRYAGNTFRLTPKHAFALGFQFAAPLSRHINFFVRPSYSYKSKVYFEEDNGDDAKQDAFGLMNLRAGIELSKSGLSMRVFVNNAFDEKYVIDAGNTGRDFGTPTYIAAAPRLMGFEMTYKPFAK